MLGVSGAVSQLRDGRPTRFPCDGLQVGVTWAPLQGDLGQFGPAPVLSRRRPGLKQDMVYSEVKAPLRKLGFRGASGPPFLSPG